MTNNEYNKLKELYEKGMISEDLYKKMINENSEKTGDYGSCRVVLYDFDKFLKENRGLNKKTIIGYSARIRKLIRFQKDCNDLAEIENEAFEPFTAKLLNDFLITRAVTDCSDVTLVTYLTAFRIFNEFCKSKDIPCCDDNNIMSVSVSPSKSKAGYESYFTNKEVEKMIKYAYANAQDLTEKSVAIIIALTWELMLQKNVIKSLKLDDYDRESNTLSFEERGLNQRLLLSKETGAMLYAYIEQIKEEIPQWHRYKSETYRDIKVDNLLFQTKVTETVSNSTIFDRLTKFKNLFLGDNDQRTISSNTLIISKKIYLLSKGCSFEEINKQARIKDKYLTRFTGIVESLYPQATE